MGAFKATRCRQTLCHCLMKTVMRILHSRVIHAIHPLIRPLVVAYVLLGYNSPCPSFSLHDVCRFCSYVILSAMHVCCCLWGLSRPPDASKQYATAFYNSPAHDIFTCHIGSRCSTPDCMSICVTFLLSGKYLKNLFQYLGQPHHIRQAVVHPRLQYLLGLPLVSHMSRVSVSCQCSWVLCFMVHQCEFLQNTSEHMCPVPFVFWRYTQWCV